MIPLFVLDLAPISKGSNASQALRNSLDLAQHAEALGCALLDGRAPQPGLPHRSRAGPHHRRRALIIAEQFGTLAALHPGRIDLGLDLAPGIDQIAACAPNLAGNADQFP